MNRASRNMLLALIGTTCSAITIDDVCADGDGSARRRVLRVPADYSLIQSAIDAAEDGDAVLVSPGIYHEGLVISGKSVRLLAEAVTTNGNSAIDKTVLSGEIEETETNDGRRDEVILVEKDAGPDTVISGFTIHGGDDGIACYASITIRNNRFTNNEDAIDYEGGGGLCEHNHFQRNQDDAIDLDQDCAVTIQHNTIVNNLDDGIEIRLHPHNGDALEVDIRNNVIAGNAEDGIQIIDYPGVTERTIRIENNLMARNSMAAIGMMSDANTREDYHAASIPEKVEVIGNTIADSEYGVCGGGNLTISRNSFLQHQAAAIRLSADSDESLANKLTSDNLFWSNGEDFDVATENDR